MLRRLNIFFAILVAGGIGGAAVLVFLTKRASQRGPIPPGLQALRNFRQKAVEAERRGAFREAESYYRAAFERQPDSSNTMIAMAQFYDRTKQQRKCLETCRSFAPILIDRKIVPPGGAELLLHYGDACLQAGRAADARRAYTTVVQADSAMRVSHNGAPLVVPDGLPKLRALVYVLCGTSNILAVNSGPRKSLQATRQQHEKYLRTAVTIDPGSVAANAALASLLARSDRHAEAGRFLQAAESKVPRTDYTTLWSLAEIYHEIDRPNDSLRLTKAACRMFDHQDTYRKLAFVQFADFLHQRDEADKLIARMITPAIYIKPYDVSNLAYYLIASRRRDLARSFVREGIRRADLKQPGFSLDLLRVAFALGMDHEANSFAARLAPFAESENLRQELLHAKETRRFTFFRANYSL